MNTTLAYSENDSMNAPAVSYSERFDFTVSHAYHPNNNYLLAQLCGLVYDKEDDINKQVETWKKHDPSLKHRVVTIDQKPLLDDPELDDFFEKTSRFMVVYNDDYIVLSFRGSDNIVDWIKNLKRVKTPFLEGEGKVHLGFYQTVKNMQARIDGVIHKIRTSDQPVYICGHSLGGAQALLSAFVCKSLKNFAYITTFGQPRVGDKEFMNWINPKILNKSHHGESRYFRVVNKYDPVANLPYIGFYHVGGFYLNCSKGSYYNIVEGATLDQSDDASANNDTNSLSAEEIEKAMIDFNKHAIALYIHNADHNKTRNPFG